MGKLNKQILKQYIEYECERQLFINLADGSNDWLKNNREIKPLKSIKRGPPGRATEFGKIYEQQIYQILRTFPNSEFSTTSEGKVASTMTDKGFFINLYDKLKNSTREVILLEHGFTIPGKFFRDIFKLGYNDDIPVNTDVTRLYPDIIILGGQHGEELLNLDGTISEVNELDNNSKIPISIIDIKKTAEESINKSYFIEVIYYGMALRYFLEENNLTDKFYINVKGNGIFPGFDNPAIFSISQLRASIVELTWRDLQRLYNKTCEKIYELWSKTKCNFEDTEPNVRSQCGRCNYYDDCIETLGGNGPPPGMDVKLIPYTSNATTRQLNEYNITTVDELVNNINKINIGMVPKPIYSEIPILELKGRALQTQKVAKPAPGDLTSMAIPKYNDISIIINFEEDPLHNRVFGMSVYYNVSVNVNSYYYKKYEIWWEIWDDYLNNNLDRDEVSDRFEFDLGIRPSRKDLLEIERILAFLKKAGVQNYRKGDTYQDSEGNTQRYKQSFMILEYAFVNEDLIDSSEYEFTQLVVLMLYNLVRFSSYMEQYIVEIVRIEDKDYYYSPTSAIFYWSQEILSIIENLVERHLAQLMVDHLLNKELSYLMTWFTPSESMVKDEVQFRKIFDLRRFIEMAQALPHRINYTWHGVYSYRRGKAPISSTYYSPHFNYMDHNNWYNFLHAKETSSALLLENRKSRGEWRENIKKQLLFKVNSINYLRRDFQKLGREQISKANKKPARNADLDQNKVPNTYHDIARIWYLFSKLNGTYSELEAAEFRHQYPQYSIGKLAAAEVKNIEVFPHTGTRGGKSYTYNFELHGLSTNMKLKVRDWVLFLPNEERDFIGNSRRWEIEIESLEWDPNGNALKVATQKTSSNFFEMYKDEYDKDPSQTSWFIYPKGGEFWSSKLQKLLASFDLGRSWLGFRLGYVWSINPIPLDSYFHEMNLPEIYAYYPSQLNKIEPSGSSKLVTNVKFSPNPSQELAIKNAMNNVVSSIQGPPGTGKSQTIVALIDEFVLQHGRNPKILITSFSYQALNVLVEKISESIDRNNKPTAVAKINRIFIRSSYKERHPLAHDLVRRGKGTWRLDDQPRLFTKDVNLLDHFPDGFIMFGVAHQIYHLRDETSSGRRVLVPEEFAFDLIVVDEASQMPVDQVLASLIYVKKAKAEFSNMPDLVEDEKLDSTQVLNSLKLKINAKFENLTKLVLVGDNNQLPPVQPVPPPKNLDNILGSLFTYYIKYHEIPNQQLEVNYRSHEIIVEFTRRLGFYDKLTANITNANNLLNGNFNNINKSWVKMLMDPSKVVGTVIHNHQFETAVSMIEAQIVVELILAYYEMDGPKDKNEEQKFFLEKIGVVAPHNAQGRLIIRNVYDEIQTRFNPNLNENELMSVLQLTIFSVEKFQGSDRNFIIGSIGISSTDQLGSEEEFIYEINRFNVLSSRAKNKLILICSNNFLDFFPKNRDIMSHASKIKDFAFDYCNQSQDIQLTCEEHNIDETLEFRYRNKL